MITELWVERYRPKNIKDYVFQSDKQRRKIESWITNRDVPHLLLSGTAGTGKTSLIQVILNELDVSSNDIMLFNGSDETGVDHIRNKVGGFCSIIPFGDRKYVFIDEADYLSHNSQGCLRHMMEDYVDTVRFFFTCNKPHMILDAIHSRTQSFSFGKPSFDQFNERVINILIEEGITIDDESLPVLQDYINVTYPDLRKCINVLQQNCDDGKLLSPDVSDNSDADYLVTAIAQFRMGKYKDARETICRSASPQEYDDIFKFMYNNLELWCEENDKKKRDAIIIVRDGLAKAPLCADPEINLSATFAQLEKLAAP